MGEALLVRNWEASGSVDQTWVFTAPGAFKPTLPYQDPEDGLGIS